MIDGVRDIRQKKAAAESNVPIRKVALFSLGFQESYNANAAAGCAPVSPQRI